MISREEALRFLNQQIENKNVVKHMLATEAVMRALARHFDGNEDEWGLAGLLHDGDYLPEVPKEKQGIRVSEMLKERGFVLPEEVKQAMAAHNWHNNGVEPKSKMDWALFCGDSLTGLIVASTLVLHTKKLVDLTVENVLRRFKERRFAAGTRREDIALCGEKLGIPLEEFVKIALEAMQDISRELRL